MTLICNKGMILVRQCIVISKNSAIDIAFRKALLSLSEHKNEVTKKIVYHVLALT